MCGGKYSVFLHLARLLHEFEYQYCYKICQKVYEPMEWDAFFDSHCSVLELTVHQYVSLIKQQ